MNEVTRKALRDVGKSVQPEVVARVPVASQISPSLVAAGFDEGDLKNSVKVRVPPKKRRGDQAISVEMGGEGLGYVLAVEHGTQYQTAQHPLTSAFDATKGEALNKLQRALIQHLQAKGLMDGANTTN